jgi:hypothetical protein
MQVKSPGPPGHTGPAGRRTGPALMLQCNTADKPCVPSTARPPTMINVILALVPLTFATGSLVWAMTSGARAQARSDAWAAQWMRDNA